MEKLIFNENIQTILLSVKKEIVDLDIVKNFAVAENLLPKHEFHITIIGRETGESLVKENIDFNKLKELAESFEWNFRFDQEFYFITKDYEEEQRKSIIQLVQLPSLGHFYEQLNKITEQNFAVPFSHITLFTNSTKEENSLRGIGIYSEADLIKLSPRHLVLE